MGYTGVTGSSSSLENTFFCFIVFALPLSNFLYTLSFIKHDKPCKSIIKETSYQYHTGGGGGGAYCAFITIHLSSFLSLFIFLLLTITAMKTDRVSSAKGTAMHKTMIPARGTPLGMFFNKHVMPSRLNLYPCGQTHLKPPRVLRQ